MTNQLAKQLVKEAKKIGLADIHIDHRSKRKALTATCPSGARIKTFFSACPKDSRAQKNAIAVLRRAVRATEHEATA